MLPNNAIAAAPVAAPFLAPDITDTDLTQSLEYGGVALNDASQGRLVQVWRAWIADEGTSIRCAPLVGGTPETTLVTGASGITSVSLAFDAAMTPTVCYFESGLLKLRWYDATAEVFVTDSFPLATSGRVTADDKRRGQEGVSDVIFAYTRASTLYWRQQRDRYLIERTVGPCGGRLLRRLGMNEDRRLQFEVI